MLLMTLRKVNTPSFLEGLHTYTTTLEFNLEVPQKTGSSSILRPSYIIPGHVPKICSTISQGHVLHRVQSSLTHTSQKLEANQFILTLYCGSFNVVI